MVVWAVEGIDSGDVPDGEVPFLAQRCLHLALTQTAHFSPHPPHRPLSVPLREQLKPNSRSHSRLDEKDRAERLARSA